jgi:choline dehydrogenase-like flavoprotein
LRHGKNRLFPKVRLSAAAQEKHHLLDATAVFLHEHDDPALRALRRLISATRVRDPWQASLDDIRTGLGAPTMLAREAFRRYCLGRAVGAPPSRVGLQLWLEQAPDRESRVTLDDSRDRMGLRRAKVRWRCGDQEIATSRALTRWIAEDLQRLGLAKVTDLGAMRDNAEWLESMTDAAHPSGTTRMSLGPREGVVDRDLQVHGVHGLFVVGASVFPIAGYANPTLTIVALALRLAEHLSGSGSTDRLPLSGPEPLKVP